MTKRYQHEVICCDHKCKFYMCFFFYSFIKLYDHVIKHPPYVNHFRVYHGIPHSGTPQQASWDGAELQGSWWNFTSCGCSSWHLTHLTSNHWDFTPRIAWNHAWMSKNEACERSRIAASDVSAASKNRSMAWEPAPNNDLVWEKGNDKCILFQLGIWMDII